jgi:hypothetical protein
MSERKDMPLVHLEQEVPLGAGLDRYLADLAKRVVWYLGCEPHVIFEHPYADLGIYVWLHRHKDDEYMANILVADQAHAEAHLPVDVFRFDLAEILRQELVTLRDVQRFMQSDEWGHLLNSARVRRWIRGTAA